MFMPQEPRTMQDTDSSADLSRRFGGLNRLYGEQALEQLGTAHVAVAGLGGVGSWCVEALARSGVGALTLIDFDHIAESNINRQLHALSSTLGQSKVQAMADRIREINPACRITVVDDFVTPENVNKLFSGPLSALVDCTDQAPAKIAMILDSRRRKLPLVVCGGAGGKTSPLSLRAGDLSQATHDALLSKLRQTLRRQHGYARAAAQAGKAPRRIPRMGVRVLWFDEPVRLPLAWTQDDPLQGLSCAGYGSAVVVTAAMGMAAAAEVIQVILNGRFAS